MEPIVLLTIKLHFKDVTLAYVEFAALSPLFYFLLFFTPVHVTSSNKILQTDNNNNKKKQLLKLVTEV